MKKLIKVMPTLLMYPLVIKRSILNSTSDDGIFSSTELINIVDDEISSSGTKEKHSEFYERRQNLFIRRADKHCGGRDLIEETNLND